MMHADLIVHSIGSLVTPKPLKTPARNDAMSEITEYKNAFIAVKGETIMAVGEGDYGQYLGAHTKCISAHGKLVTPGYIDSHTHVTHAGSREYEFEKKLKGVPYLEILKQGGGIHSTVKSTREASFEAMQEQTKKSLDRMLAFGATTVEGKSGYGLNLETELKQLRVQKALNESHPIDLIATFMGAHALPKAYREIKETYLQEVIDWMQVVKDEALAENVDIFCEEGVFSVEESRRILESAKAHGFHAKIHADEIVSLGGVSLATELGALSADHLMAITDEGIRALSNSNTIATLLPSTSFNLGSAYAPARKMIDSGCALSLASDYNPGSSPSENFGFTLNLAAIHLKMNPSEVLNAATLNASFAVNRGGKIGVLAAGYLADFIIHDAPNWPYVLYHFAVNHVTDVFKRGVHVVKNKTIWRDNHETD